MSFIDRTRIKHHIFSYLVTPSTSVSEHNYNHYYLNTPVKLLPILDKHTPGLCTVFLFDGVVLKDSASSNKLDDGFTFVYGFELSEPHEVNELEFSHNWEAGKNEILKTKKNILEFIKRVVGGGDLTMAPAYFEVVKKIIENFIGEIKILNDIVKVITESMTVIANTAQIFPEEDIQAYGGINFERSRYKVRKTYVTFSSDINPYNAIIDDLISLKVLPRFLKNISMSKCPVVEYYKKGKSDPDFLSQAQFIVESALKLFLYRAAEKRIQMNDVADNSNVLFYFGLNEKKGDAEMHARIVVNDKREDEPKDWLSDLTIAEDFYTLEFIASPTINKKVNIAGFEIKTGDIFLFSDANLELDVVPITRPGASLVIPDNIINNELIIYLGKEYVNKNSKIKLIWLSLNGQDEILQENNRFKTYVIPGKVILDDTGLFPRSCALGSGIEYEEIVTKIFDIYMRRGVILFLNKNRAETILSGTSYEKIKNSILVEVKKVGEAGESKSTSEGESYGLSDSTVAGINWLSNFAQMLIALPPGDYHYVPYFKQLVTALHRGAHAMVINGVTFYISYYGIITHNINRYSLQAGRKNNSIYYLVPAEINIETSDSFVYPINQSYSRGYPLWVRLTITFVPISNWIHLYGNFLGLDNLIAYLGKIEETQDQ